MKKMIKLIKEFFYILRYFKRWRKSKIYESKIRRGILDYEAEKIMVLISAKKMIPEKTKQGFSKFIPFSPYSKAEIKAMILKEFGYKMKVLGIKITDDLKFI